MLITMLADRFEAGGVLRAKGTQVDVATDLAMRWIGDGVATPVGNSRETGQGIRKEVPVTQDQISGQQFAGAAPVSGDSIPGLVAGNESAASHNTTKINEALAAGKSVELTGVDAVYWINDTLIQYSNSRLILLNGARVKMVAGVNKSVVSNYAAAVQSWTNVTVAWTSGNQATVTWPDNEIAIGDSVVLDESSGAGQSQYRGNFLAIGKSGDDLTVMLWARPTAAPSGTYRAKKADASIYTSGAFDYNATGNPSATGTDTIALAFAGVRGLRVIEPKVYDTKKYCLAFEAVDDADIFNLYSPNAASDGAKDYGPSRNVRIRGVTGVYNDDCVSVQPREAAAYAQYTRTGGGDCINVTVSNVNAVSTNASGVVFYGSTNERGDDIAFEDIDCVTSGQMVKIYNGVGYSNSLNGILRLKDIRWNTSADKEHIVMDASQTWKHIVLDGFLGGTVAGIAGITKSPITFATGFCEQLTLMNVRGYIGTNIPIVNMSGTFGAHLIDLVAADCQATASNGTLLRLGNSGTMRAVRVSKPKCATFAKLVDVTSSVTSSPVVTIEDADVNSAIVVDAQAACKVVLAGGNRFTASTAVVNTGGTGTAIAIHTHGSNTLASGNWLAKSGTPALSVFCEEMVLDISLLARTRGARCITSVAAGPIPANTPVVCDGTFWAPVMGGVNILMFNAALSAATSGTLTAAFNGATGAYNVIFGDGSVKSVNFTNASAAVTWTGAVTAGPGATLLMTY